MKQTKLNLDTRPQQQPEGTYPFGKNGIQNDLDNSVFNEPGFRNLSAAVPYKAMGLIETDSKPIIFSTDNINSAIGYFNPVTEVYEPIVNDATWDLAPDKLDFSTEFYITGQTQRNYKGEMVIAFTDKHTWPKYLNCDNPSLSSIDDMRLFPYFRAPVITVVQSQGGRLPPGAYYVAIGYERNDGTSSPYSAVSSTVIVTPAAVVGTTDKALAITIDNADENYDNIRVAIIAKVDGKTTAVELNDFFPVTGSTLHLDYTGDNLSTDIDVSQILVPPALYNRVGTIGQLNDALYIADLDTEADFNDMQPYALTVGIEWVSELINASAPPQEHINGIRKSFMHEEVYAFYIRYSKTRGGFTKWFTVPGTIPNTLDLSDSYEANAGGQAGVPSFRVDDTIHYYDPASKTGACGVWQNETENYPGTPDFNTTLIGGTTDYSRDATGNLGLYKVLHHKMPSLRWCKEKLYKDNDDYGRTHLDLLGIRAVGVRIPPKYADLINGYEIGYAIRNVGNMTVYGQGILLHGARADSANTPVFTTGGNWKSVLFGRGGNNSSNLSVLRKDTFRFHAFDILFNKPSITPTFLSAQLKLRRAPQEADYLEDGAIGSGNERNAPVVFLLDYTIGDVPKQIPVGGNLRKIDSSNYLVNQINANDFVNVHHEDTFAGLLGGTEWPLGYTDASFRTNAAYTEASLGMPAFEETYLMNLIANKTDVYANFYSQALTSAGSAKDIPDITPFWGGDAFLSPYTFHTYGRHDSTDQWGSGYMGKKVIRRIVCESIANINLRYEIPGNEYSKWYPHNPAVKDTPDQCYPVYWDRSKDPNQFGYSKDFNALNNLISSVTFSPFREELTKFPFRVHRGGKNVRQNKLRSWRTFLPLDFYEMQKNMGRIVNALGMDDRLLIHCENALFYTQDKAQLDSGVLSITLGSGDIFRFEPQEAQSAKLGYGGTQHDLAAVQTVAGYIYPDMEQGELYLYKEDKAQKKMWLTNLNPGINSFLREFMRVKDKNVFSGNGATIGWDQKYKRVLLTVKNKILVNREVKPKVFANTPAFWDNLHIGDIVSYKGRLVEYKGVNTSTDFTCPETQFPLVYSWEKRDPYCLEGEDGVLTGMKAWTNRVRLTNGWLDGTTEANAINEGDGTYFPPEPDSTLCMVPEPDITWEPFDPFCLKQSELTHCPDGYTLNSDSTACVKVLSSPADQHSETPIDVDAAIHLSYSNFGTVIYSSFNVNGTGTITSLLDFNPWNNSVALDNVGPMNRCGVYAGNPALIPDNEPVGFTRTVTIYTSGVYYIGMGGDNKAKLAIDGTLIVEQEWNAVATQMQTAYPSLGFQGAASTFKWWYIFPVYLVAGQHFFSMEVVNFNNASAASFGMEVYGNTVAELSGAALQPDFIEGDAGSYDTFGLNYFTNLNLLYSTRWERGGYFTNGSTTGYSCDSAGAGYALDTTTEVPTCKKILTTAPTVSSEITNTGYKGFKRRRQLSNGKRTGFEEPNITGLNYFPPVQDLDICPVVHTTTLPVAIVGAVNHSCSDDDCTNQGLVSLNFTFPAATPIDMVLHIGVVINYYAGLMHVGDSIFTPPVGSIAWPSYDIDPYSTGVSHATPFRVNIPAGSTAFTVREPIYQDTFLGGIYGQWTCHNCQFPLKSMYFKMVAPTAGYTLTMTSNDPDVNVYNV